MAKINKHIEIVSSAKSGLSSMGQQSRADIQTILLKRYARVNITLINDLSGLEALVARRPDMVFLGMKFIPTNPNLGLADPDKIWLSKYLAAEGISHTGSSHTAIELELNKELAKQSLLDVGISTPRYQVVQRGEGLRQVDSRLRYPLFVKPTNRGGGGGIDAGSLVRTFRQLQSKVRSLATELLCDVLIEEYLPGREFSVGIMKQPLSDTYVAMPLEIVAPLDESGERFLSSQIKRADTERVVGLTDGLLKANINAVALSAFHALGAQDYGRIDIRLDAAGIPHFLEANLLPSLVAGYGNFPKTCLLNMGLKHESMVLSIIDLAFSRAASAGDTFDEATLPFVFVNTALSPA